MVAPEQSELFRLKACPGCDYSLETLPAEGTCPECGRRYDQRFIVLTGRGRGRWDGAAGGTWRGMVSHSVWAVILLWFFTRGRRAFDGSHLLAWGVLGAVVMGTQLYAWLFSAREPRMQLWLSPEGVGQIPSTPEGRRAHAVAGGASLFFVPIFVAGLFIENGRWPTMMAMPLIAVAIIVAPIVWTRWRIPRGSEEDVNFTPGLWQWDAIERIQINRVSDGRVWVRCQVTRKWRWIAVSKDWVIDIEVDCPANVAEALGRQMVAWCPRVA